MLKVENVKVYDLKESVIASGNAMRIELPQYTEEEFKKGICRLVRLNRASKGDVKCHNHALCGINVAFDVLYPQYWTPEFQRYHFAEIITSSSKMHRLNKMGIRKATNKYVSPAEIVEAQKHVNNYNDMLDNPNKTSFGYYDTSTEVNTWVVVEGREEALYAAFMVMVSNCPCGLELFMRVSTNYLELQNIYFQRRHHRLKEDWGAFCDMIEGLPYFKELILGEEDETDRNSQ